MPAVFNCGLFFCNVLLYSKKCHLHEVTKPNKLTVVLWLPQSLTNAGQGWVTQTVAHLGLT